MNIPANQIESKKKVGKVNGKDVWHLKSKGGLHVVIDQGGKVLGAGPHKAVSYHLAQKFEPDIVWSELSKCEWVDPQDYAHLVPKYEEITLSLRKMQDAGR